MKHLARYSLLLTLLVSALVYCFAQSNPPSRYGSGNIGAMPEVNPNNWKEFSSAEGRFSILFPGAPTEKAVTVNSEFGQRESHIFTLKTMAEYSVSYTDHPTDLESSDRAREGLKGALYHVVARHKGQILEEKEIDLDGHPGRRIKVQLANGQLYWHEEFFVGNRNYQIIFITRDAGAPPAVLKFHNSTAAKFLDSFKLNLPAKNR